MIASSRLNNLSIVIALVASLLSFVTTPAKAIPAPICSTGGTCTVGETGPGGGIIFYVAPTTFTQLGATGSMCTTGCKYLEAAPTTGTANWTDADYAWSGNTNTLIGATAQGTAIGTGYANTLAIVGQSSGGNTAGKAGTASRAYLGPNGKTDWFLPSKDELHELRLQRTVTAANGFGGNKNYWSSTEISATNARYLYFDSETLFTTEHSKSLASGIAVRPIRAVGPPPVTYTITLAAGTSGTGSNQTLTKTDGESLTLPISATANGYFTRAGYSVTGWSTTNLGSQTHALGGAFTTEADTTLYPVWTPNTNTVTFDTQGGSAVSAQDWSTGASLTLPPAPTQAGYTFNGWFDASSGGTQVGTASNSSNGLDFDGVNDRITIPHAASFNFTSAATVEVWFNTTSTRLEYITTKGNDSFFLATNVTGDGGAGANSVSLWFQGPSVNAWLHAGTIVNDGKWHHAAGTYDGSTLKLYVDGVLRESRAASGAIESDTSDVEIGSRSGSADSSFTGRLYDIRYWNVARSADQISSSKNAQPYGSESGLVAAYSLNQGTAGGTNTGATTATNTRSGSGIGTLSGFALTGATSNWVQILGTYAPEDHSSFTLFAQWTTVIASAAIAGVTVPVTSATPVTAVTAGTGYTGTVSWASSAGPLVGNFQASTIYTATITLTATAGYTLTGVAADFFTVTGTSSSATNPINSGVITAVFPATAAPSRQVTCGAGTYTITAGVASAGTSCTGALVIASDVTEIATEAFRGAAITNLILPSNLHTIRYAAFYETSQYPSLTIPNSVTLIESQAFEQGQFTSLTIGNGLTAIGSQVFYRNYGIRINSVTFGTGLTSIGGAAFQNFGVEKLTLPEGLTTLSSRTFDSTSTTILSLPNSLTTIASDSFVNASLRIVKYCGTSSSVTNFNFGFLASVCGAIVDFNPNLGSGSMDATISSTNSALPTNTFTRSGYTFQGWNTESNGSGTPYAAGAVFPFSTPTDRTLYAVWLADLAAPAFTLSAASGSVTTGSAFTSYTISSTGGAIASYSISPAISNGTLTFNASTGLLSGTPTSAASETTYTITATNSTSTATQTFSLTINSSTPEVVFIPPTPVPYLKTLTSPQMRLTGGKLVCSPGTYNSGHTLNGVIQGSPTALFTPASFTYNLLINGVTQTSLAVTTAATSASWDVVKASSGSLVACSVTISANSLTNTDKSSDNTSGVSAALSTQTQAIAAAESAASEVISANSKTYQKALVENRSLWRKQVESLRANYYETLARITASSGSRKMITDKSAALKAMITAQKKSASDYKASGPAALATKDAANKVALDAKNEAIAKANANYGTSIESIGYGVLIP